MFLGKKRPLSITFLGGSDGYVGHNCLVCQSGDSAVVVDCGIKPQTYKEREEDLTDDGGWPSTPPPHLNILDDLLRKGVNVLGAITHAHLDHIGAVRELTKRRIPVHLSAWSKDFMNSYDLAIPGAMFYLFGKDTILRHGDMQISFIPLQHSIPGTYGVLIRSGGKNILHLTDFKFNGFNKSIDETGEIFQKIRRNVGRINCLIMDVLNAELPGFTPPEQQVLDSVEKIIKEASDRVIITLFSSNLQRIDEIVKIAKAQRKTVGMIGRSMISSYGLLSGKKLPQDGDVVLMTGSQGEENSALSRIAQGQHRYFSIRPGDTVLVSARAIPGNEDGIRMNLLGLHSQGAEIFLHYGESKKLNLRFLTKEAFLHVSGHGQIGDLSETINIFDPEIVIPFHAPADRYEIFSNLVSGRKIQRLSAGETLKI